MIEPTANNFQKWLEILKIKWQKLSDTSTSFTSLAIFFGIGFIIGFLLKNIGRFLIWIILGGTVALLLLHILNIVPIDYEILEKNVAHALSASGISQLSFNQVWAHSISWVKTHITECLALVIGLFLSWELM